MKKVCSIIISVLMLISCSEDDDISMVNIRLSNISQFNFQNIIIDTSIGSTGFENLNSQKKSDYKVFQKAYRYAFIELQIDGKIYTIQPIDYVGESLLENGNYTYQIDANDSEEQYGKLTLTLIKD